MLEHDLHFKTMVKISLSIRYLTGVGVLKSASYFSGIKFSISSVTENDRNLFVYVYLPIYLSEPLNLRSKRLIFKLNLLSFPGFS